jgi:hypothetical protein
LWRGHSLAHNFFTKKLHFRWERKFSIQLAAQQGAGGEGVRSGKNESAFHFTPQIVVMASKGNTGIPAISVSGNVYLELQTLGSRVTLLPGPDFDGDAAQNLAKLTVDFTVFMVAFCAATLVLTTALYVVIRKRLGTRCL